MKMRSVLLFTFLISLFACSCGSKTTKNTSAVKVYEQISPNFDADSAYAFIQNQVDFGYRVPNTKAHELCGDYLVNELKRFGADVQEQKMLLTAFDGTKLKSRNIIGSYSLDKKNRILLFAHWDTRPFSDQDEDEKNYNKPILGANDGGSGVGALLEIARVIQSKSPEVGIDIIFFDSEDYGPPAFAKEEKPGEWWCLGSQYWSKNPHIPNYQAKYGILLDMVAGKDARFHKEQVSMHYAKNIVEKVWSTARQLRYGNYFVNKIGGALTDDHLPVNQFRLIPSIDIVQFDPESEKGFGDYWHTQADDMSNVSKETLKAVGQTVLEVIYKEKDI